MSDFIGEWGLYPWVAEHGDQMINEPDRELLREINPLGKVFYCASCHNEFISIHYGDNCFLVKSDLFQPVSKPKAKIGQKVLMGVGSISGSEAIIQDIHWHSLNQKHIYFVSISGKKRSRRYYEEDFSLESLS